MKMTLVMQAVRYDDSRETAKSVLWWLSSTLITLLFVFVLILIVFMIFDMFENDWLITQVDTFIFKMKNREGVKRLQELVGKSTSRWILLNISRKGSIAGVDDEAIAELTPPEKRFFVAIESFIMNPVRYRFMYDYDEIIQSTHAMNVILTKESSVTDSEFWDARKEVIDEIWKQLLDEMAREGEKIHTAKELELEVVRKRTEDDMRDLEDLKRFRGKL